MPHADVVNDPKLKVSYFQNRFKWQEPQHLYWAYANDKVVGFVNLTLKLNKHVAFIDDFYVLNSERRKGYGRKMVNALYKLLEQWNINNLELNVRRDTPHALAFWESVGFRVAHYRMRQFRDPETGQWLIGALSSDFVE